MLIRSAFSTMKHDEALTTDLSELRSGMPGDMVRLMLPGLSILACWVLLIVYWNISARSIKPAAEQQSWAGRLARLPIWLGYILLIAAWVPPFANREPSRNHIAQDVGVAICAIGVLLAIWSRKTLGEDWSRDVELKQGHKLVDRGPYKFVRHPIYTSHLFMGLGTAVASGSLIGFVGLLFFFIGFWIKLRQEETLLLRFFPDEYPAYQARVKKLLPFLF
jgi:protein-S-isoprenylcysteine O-methyltransferase Ste14